ncbi:MAG: hypothetical protein JJE04_02485 [Acidobacteriia bacterium]|nr:hypothetical protein [Terriglobia bacterium]
MDRLREERPGYRKGHLWGELLTALHSNGVRTILIERLDRLARDLMIQKQSSPI